MKNPWFAFYPADYLGDTVLLSLEEHGAYLLLLCHYWNAANAPANAESLYKICRCTCDSERRAVDAVASRYFERDGDVLRNRRLDAEIAKARSISEKRRIAGREGAAKTNAKTAPNDAAKDRQLPTQSQSQSHTQGKDKELNPKAGAVALAKDPLAFLGEFPQSFQDTPEFVEAWKKWIAHRKEKGSALHRLKTGAKEAIKALCELTPGHAAATINHSVEKGWTGLFPDSVQKLKGGQPTEWKNHYAEIALEGRAKNEQD